MTALYLVLTLSLFSFMIFLYYIVKMYRMAKPRRRVQTWFKTQDEEKRRSFIFLLGDQFDESLMAEELDKKLKQGAIPMKPSEYAAICIGLFLVLWLISRVILELMFPIDLVVAYVIVKIGSNVYLKTKREKRSEAFNQQLPDVCRMLGNTVKAGLTLQQGITMAGKELKAPAGPEFAKMSRQLSLGDSFERVVYRFIEQVDSREVKVMMNTVLIQRRIGGNLAEVMEMMAGTLEERGRVHKEMSAVTAESKYVAFILPILPIATAIMLNLFIPGFLNPLFTPLGLILIAVFVVVLVISSYAIKKVTDIRV
ncbi:tight adherence protein B [Alteribacillus persepolensis]|uniref:Tight adherence protein B n=1 Tax=Alteribacillus persepolensis TaxID=568899 RepID=A0A1G8EYG1_9BACI|nr:type II secretion system F family protein [Alteribacillus persepolensis]SDH74749.1 tight adherence protein B [Alteribacillus persepolensis]